MSGIVCAIRGGPHSQSTIDVAIKLARETGQPLYFLYIVNLEFLKRTSSSRLRTITEEMSQLGEFILANAQNQAAAQGVEAEGVLRKGNVTEEIISLSTEIAASFIILGCPRGNTEQDVFTHARLQKLIGHIEGESDAKVVLAEG